MGRRNRHSGFGNKEGQDAQPDLEQSQPVEQDEPQAQPEPMQSDEPLEYDAVVADLTQQRDDALGRYQRALADFQNYQRRSLANERAAAVQARAGVLKSLLPVIDNLDLALSQQIEDSGGAKALHAGVQLVRDELLKVCAGHGVERVEPALGDEFDPERHEAMLTMPAPENVQPGHVANLLQPGYAVGTVILRPAKVALAEGEVDPDAIAADNEYELENDEQ
ncbi:MAG: nucleotide exchange factor GrpE [Planctomycetes bacterium]|nr:nucleotide exchange factor GrpE [Planctomycetota bacterium]NOG54303.1 nucleotide exchange factor GrpE [Planctomycetota bacterium]